MGDNLQLVVGQDASSLWQGNHNKVKAISELLKDKPIVVQDESGEYENICEFFCKERV